MKFIHFHWNLQIINGNNLKILGLVASDFGIYQCIGSNPAGNVQAAASLTIYSSGMQNLDLFLLSFLSHSTVHRPIK
jgi:hypothetical protein